MKEVEFCGAYCASISISINKEFHKFFIMMDESEILLNVNMQRVIHDIDRTERSGRNRDNMSNNLLHKLKM